MITYSQVNQVSANDKFVVDSLVISNNYSSPTPYDKYDIICKLDEVVNR